MAIIAHKNDLQTFNNFISSTKEKTYIDGIIVSITLTKDDRLIVFDLQQTIFTTQLIQKSTLDDLKNSTVLELDTFLNDLNDYKKRIILNIYPLMNATLSDETIQYFNEQNNRYINIIYKIITKYPSLNIALATISNQLLQVIKRNILEYKKGLIILQENLNYTDTDFYILAPTMLDSLVFKEQLDHGKELMIYSYSTDDMTIIISFFKNSPNPLKQEIFYKLTFITSYPDIFYKAVSLR